MKSQWEKEGQEPAARWLWGGCWVLQALLDWPSPSGAPAATSQESAYFPAHVRVSRLSSKQ